jgi:DNA-binding LacI/PurR family transcriptional regulator
VQHHTLLWGDLATNAAKRRGINGTGLQQLYRQMVAGVFFAPLELTKDRDRVNQSVIAALEAAGIPIVLLDRDTVAFPQRSRFDLVGIDNRRAGFLIANHFLKHGHRRIDFLARPGSAPTVTLRIAGYREALLSSGVAPDPQWVHSATPRRNCLSEDCGGWSHGDYLRQRPDSRQSDADAGCAGHYGPTGNPGGGI